MSGCSVKRSLKEDKDQKSKQSSNTPDPGYQWESQDLIQLNIKSV